MIRPEDLKLELSRQILANPSLMSEEKDAFKDDIFGSIQRVLKKGGSEVLCGAENGTPFSYTRIQERLQRVYHPLLRGYAEEVMAEFGFDPNNSHSENITPPWDSEGTLRFSNGDTRQMLIFPNNSGNGLVFKKWTEVNSNGTQVIWFVEGPTKIDRLKKAVRKILPQRGTVFSK